MMSNLLTAEILAALASQPEWVVIMPSATSNADHVDGVTAAPPSTEPPATGMPVVGRVTLQATSQTLPYEAVVDPECPRCGMAHRLERCPQVKSVEYHEDGRRIKRVEFHEPPQPPGTWPSNATWVPASAYTCPKCNGHGRVPFYLPLASDPIGWDTCDQCHGHGLVAAGPAMVTTAPAAYRPLERGDEEE